LPGQQLLRVDSDVLFAVLQMHDQLESAAAGPALVAGSQLATAAPAGVQMVPVAQTVPVVVLANREGCAGLRCTHITITVFGFINMIVGILSILSGDLAVLILNLAMGMLGIVAGLLMNPCGCCTDPVSGSCACGKNTKCIAIISMINSVIHVVVIIVIILFMAMIGEACDIDYDYDYDYDGSGGCGGGAVVAILGAITGWYFFSLIVCIMAAVTAWKAGGGGTPVVVASGGQI
jgi:hypothetical protein